MTDFEITADGPRLYFLTGELDMSTLPLMETAIAPGVAKGGPVTLDMSGLTFIDSTGVASILRSLKALPSGCIVLHGVRDAVKQGPRSDERRSGLEPACDPLHGSRLTRAAPYRPVALRNSSRKPGSSS